MTVGDGDADGDAPEVADGLGLAALDAVALGAGDAPLKVTQAFVSWDSTDRHAERAPASHAVPSEAVRETATSTNG